jgi:hypothetical protein
MMPSLRHLSCLICLLSCASISAQDKKIGWPLTLEIERSELTNLSGGNVEAARLADEMGAASPVMIMFWGTLNGESHWVFECERENSHGEENPCIELPHGKYIARWMHNRQMLQVFVEGPSGPAVRQFNVSPDPKNPPAPDDPVLATDSYDFPITKPANQQNTSYPLLVHVYGSSRMRISKGYVLLDAKIVGEDTGVVWCDAKTRVGICSPLGPGFFAGRWKDDLKTYLVLLAPVNGEIHEFGFFVEKRTPQNP